MKKFKNEVGNKILKTILIITTLAIGFFISLHSPNTRYENFQRRKNRYNDIYPITNPIEYTNNLYKRINNRTNFKNNKANPN